MARPIYTVVVEFSFAGPEFKYTKPEDVSAHIHDNERQRELANEVALFIENKFPFDEIGDSESAVDAYVTTGVSFDKGEEERYHADLKTEHDEYQAAANRIEELGDSIGIKHTIWSMDEESTGKLFRNEVFHHGKVYFQHETNDVGRFKTNPTYQDLWKIADTLTAESGDFHHVFLEAADKQDFADGVLYVHLWYGS